MGSDVIRRRQAKRRKPVPSVTATAGRTLTHLSDPRRPLLGRRARLPLLRNSTFAFFHRNWRRDGACLQACAIQGGLPAAGVHRLRLIPIHSGFRRTQPDGNVPLGVTLSILFSPLSYGPCVLREWFCLYNASLGQTGNFGTPSKVRFVSGKMASKEVKGNVLATTFKCGSVNFNIQTEDKML